MRPLYQLIFFATAYGVACSPAVQKEPEKKTSSLPVTWDSLPSRMQDVNAYYMAFIDAEGQIHEHSHGLNAQGKKLNDETLFEGASLSKTVFAYLYWHLLDKQQINRDSIHVPICFHGQKNGNIKTVFLETHHFCKISAFQLLNHTISCTDSCVENESPKQGHAFSYSENGYLMLQKKTEQKLGKNLETLAQEEVFKPNNLSFASFIWPEHSFNFVDGYYEKRKLHRPIYRFKRPLSNGTLYLNGKDLVKFTQMLMKSAELDSMCSEKTTVPGFKQLSWGRGIGIEQNQGKTYAWQWGNNWSFNHILLINKTDHTAFICLTNSIIGAKRIRESCSFLLGQPLQLFDYINWY